MVASTTSDHHTMRRTEPARVAGNQWVGSAYLNREALLSGVGVWGAQEDKAEG